MRDSDTNLKGVESAIVISNVSKVYQIFDRNIDRLKEVFHPFGKKYHQEFFALKDVSINIPRGKCVGIIGLNGSGKSTLLQCIAGVLTPSKGVIQVTGKIAALLELGAGFNSEFTGIENVRFQCAIMGYTEVEIDALLPSIIEFADIGDFVHHPVKTYSSGMYVRLAFSIAINVNPDILIVDEALAVGDIRFQAKCLAKIREFRTRGKTLLFVSHDASAVKSLCDEAFLLDRGQVISHGAPAKVFNAYNSLISEKDRTVLIEKVEIDRKSTRSGSQRVIIETTELLNSAKLQTTTFISGEELVVRLRLTANQPTASVSVGFLIRDRLGNDIFGTNSSLLSSLVDFTANSLSQTVEFAMPLSLGENVYTVTVAAHSGENHIEDNYDWHNDAAVFKVIHDAGRKFAGCASLNAVMKVQ